MGFREILDLTKISSEFKKLSMVLEMDKIKTKFCCSAPPSQTFTKHTLVTHEIK